MKAEIEECAALGPEWDALWRADAHATPFQSRACLSSWAEIYAPGRAFAVVVRDGARLVGLAPFFSWQGELLLAGTGPFDYGDGLFVEAAAGGAALAGLAHGAERLGLGRIVLRQLRPNSPLARAAAPAGWADSFDADMPCPVMPIEGAGGLAHRDAKFLSNLRRTRARAERRTELRIVTPEPAAGIATLLDLHARRWAGARDAVRIDPLAQRFLEVAAPRLAAAGLLRLFVLTLDGAPAAALLGLAGAGSIHFYLQGVDPAQRALSPGVILLAEAIARSAAEGVTAAHFLRGREPYKARWGASGGLTLRRTLRREAAT